MDNIEFSLTPEFAHKMDQDDPLRDFRNKFYIPEKNGKQVIYFCGNSLGLQPRSVSDYLSKDLEKWAKKGVDGHFEGDVPWIDARKPSKAQLANLLGASELEVVAMNSLSVNLHLLMVSFYRPKGKKYKILTEAGAFPSDQYILESQVKYHGFSPDKAIIEAKPRPNEHVLRTEDILELIRSHKDDLALIMFSGVQYYTGQLFDMNAISKEAKANNIIVGFDLAHAVGNIPLQLHDWGVDFATWCSYKYLNSGPGNVSGIFVHQKYSNDNQLPRFAGWWGHNEEERFKMEKGFKHMQGADGWLVSNDNVLGLAAHQASLDLFAKAGIENLRRKSQLLTSYLEFAIRETISDTNSLEIITPLKPTDRGCQLSLLIQNKGKRVFDFWIEKDVVADWRNPNVIRLAPTPMYNSFQDVYEFSQILKNSLND
ncbi:kynureninase [Cyclobacterium amurskyense]|uniref:Kynureninase n=1 Tax=Cyclobacterium amurskyense TaxID=320787 RepID=A0A0H4PRZ0_9BACT|nr:kynureninase [Cyclobacterium amurskyense]AKP51027.1 Kynureninase [Cyclobacterium amurskyense]|tara:strand:+ start:856 stop:2136 length:1281 start_codon:yes stop_codon:yes gene_type:complete